MASPTKRLAESFSGVCLLFLPHLEPFIPKSVFEFIGLASLPGEFQQWREATVWSLGHFCFWLPVGCGLGVILWANWDQIKVSIKNPIFRIMLAPVIVLITFFVPAFSGQYVSSSSLLFKSPLVTAKSAASSSLVGEDGSQQHPFDYASQCPIGSNVIANSSAYDNGGDGYDVSGQKFCFVNDTAHGNADGGFVVH